MKTKEELSALKAEIESMSSKLAGLSDDELQQVTGGMMPFLVLSRDTALESTPDPASPDFKGKFKLIL